MSKALRFKKRQKINQKRAERDRKRKKKFSYLRNTGQYKQYFLQKRNSKIIKTLPKPVESAPEPISKPVLRKVSFWTKLKRRIREGF